LRCLTLANVNFFLRMIDDAESGGSQHSFAACPIGHPPICWIARVAVLDEVKFRIAWFFELVTAPKIVVGGDVISLV
jgi:hypothetical protein